MKHLSAESIYNEIVLLSDDERNKLYDRMKKNFYSGNEIVAYTIDGQPLTKMQYLVKIENAIAEANRGELITDGELQKELETW